MSSIGIFPYCIMIPPSSLSGSHWLHAHRIYSGAGTRKSVRRSAEKRGINMQYGLRGSPILPLLSLLAYLFRHFAQKVRWKCYRMSRNTPKFRARKVTSGFVDLWTRDFLSHASHFKIFTSYVGRTQGVWETKMQRVYTERNYGLLFFFF